MPPVVALLTDFGQEGPYLGAMRGALLRACPEATLVDITHAIPPRDVARGAEVLGAAYRHFPPDTVFLGVVDPGVGTSRRGVAIGASGFRFVGPDNGLFSAPLRESPDAAVHAITSTRFLSGPIAPTFHGRDLFAPVAGFLAGGGAIAEVGPRVADPHRLPMTRSKRLPDGTWLVGVVDVDSFGNLTTDLGGADLEAFLANMQGRALLEGQLIPIATTYADVPLGGVLGLVGSSGRLEIAVSGGSAAAALKGSVGRRFLLSPTRR